MSLFGAEDMIVELPAFMLPNLQSRPMVEAIH